MVGWKQLLQLRRLERLYNKIHSCLECEELTEVEIKHLRIVTESVHSRLSGLKSSLTSENVIPYYYELVVSGLSVPMDEYGTDIITTAKLHIIANLSKPLHDMLISLLSGFVKLHSMRVDKEAKENDIQLIICELEDCHLQPYECEYTTRLIDNSGVEYDWVEEFQIETGIFSPLFLEWFGINSCSFTTEVLSKIPTSKQFKTLTSVNQWYELRTPNIPEGFIELDTSIFGEIYVNPDKDTVIICDSGIKVTNDRELVMLCDSSIM